MELFFDLVYVFAFTQLSEHLYEHLTLAGGRRDRRDLRGAVVVVELHRLGDRLDRPGAAPVVLLLSVLMIASLVMATAILGGVRRAGARPSRSPTWRCSCCAAASWSGSSACATRWAATTRSCWSGRRSAASSGSSAVLSTTRTRGSPIWAVAAAVDSARRCIGFRLPGAGADADVRLDDRRRAPRRALPAAADDRLWRVVPADRGELRARRTARSRPTAPSSSASCSCWPLDASTSYTTPSLGPARSSGQGRRPAGSPAPPTCMRTRRWSAP